MKLLFEICSIKSSCTSTWNYLSYSYCTRAASICNVFFIDSFLCRSLFPDLTARVLIFIVSFVCILYICCVLIIVILMCVYFIVRQRYCSVFPAPRIYSTCYTFSCSCFIIIIFFLVLFLNLVIGNFSIIFLFLTGYFFMQVYFILSLLFCSYSL